MLDPDMQNSTLRALHQYRIAGLYVGAYTRNLPYSVGSRSDRKVTDSRDCSDSDVTCVLGDEYSTLPYKAACPKHCVPMTAGCHQNGSSTPLVYNISAIHLDAG